MPLYTLSFSEYLEFTKSVMQKGLKRKNPPKRWFIVLSQRQSGV
ncbi:hypothetical protein SPAB_02181 [Salmonella enterica subsp. enterica serovar Paratyphi B str. SPB7]|uniref:Uncharacterized protein n=1 Tax=Salmonella paratyphi B (strain ATCC BAA-1250 / SPB7) TaxID=1016998 RepID=A0A6C6Z2I7_SALPB|nr:hypothetical protein SPAB_02181 [Salmonella enterica subsp. enterica serovar Paratyphi B str. SPB7]